MVMQQQPLGSMFIYVALSRTPACAASSLAQVGDLREVLVAATMHH